MKPPSEWTDTEKERFIQRHEAMVQEVKTARADVEKEFTTNIGNKAIVHSFYARQHRIATAAERIVEKFRNVKWLDEYFPRYRVDVKKQGTTCSCAKDHAEGCKQRTAKCVEVKG